MAATIARPTMAPGMILMAMLVTIVQRTTGRGITAVTIAIRIMAMAMMATTVIMEVMVVTVVTCCVLEQIKQMMKVASKASSIWRRESEAVVEFEL